MAKITFLGAGSTVFAKNVLGDVMRTAALRDSEIALYDIASDRLKDSVMMLNNLNESINNGRATIKAYLGEKKRKTALRNADYIVNAMNVGGYKPGTVIDFEIPRKYGFQQTIADTMSIGGIFRALRTIPVLDAVAEEIKEVCPDAWFLNYANPMSMLTGHLLHHHGLKAVGLCHSVQVCAELILKNTGLWKEIDPKKLKHEIAGINHMSWLLNISCHGKDLYPEIRKRAAAIVKESLKKEEIDTVPGSFEDAIRDANKPPTKKNWDMVRLEIMLRFGFYVTEGPQHSAEYYPYWIKSQYPELVDDYNIMIDRYLYVCERQIAEWEQQRKDLLENKKIKHTRSIEYASRIIESLETNKPYEIGGNVVNNGAISNLHERAIVEVPCLINRAGIHACRVGEIPEQLAALNRSHINVHLMFWEAVKNRSKEALYQAAYLDPRMAAELPLPKIQAMVDEMIKAHGEWLPKMK